MAADGLCSRQTIHNRHPEAHACQIEILRDKALGLLLTILQGRGGIPRVFSIGLPELKHTVRLSAQGTRTGALI